jgi:hypothetical protein
VEEKLWNNIQLQEKVLKYLLIGVSAVLFIIIFYTPTLKMPISWAGFLGIIKAEPSYYPFETNKSYMTVTSCGKNCQTANYHYISAKSELVVTITQHVSWYNDPKWDKRKKIKGTKYFYQEKSGSQYLYWEDTTKELELKIEFKGKDKLAKSEIVKIASSIKLEI